MDFVILKVNGKDVSQASHEEVAAAFLQAAEPISIEVLRRKRSTNSSSINEVDNPVVKDTLLPRDADKSLAVQTTGSRSCICPRCGYNITMDNIAVPMGIVSVTQDFLSVSSATGHLDELKEDLEDGNDGLADEVEFKVTIRKSSGQTNLDVICRNINTESSRYQGGFVVVDQIRDEQTGKDGLLCEGDRIVLINNQSIRDADHAMRMFADPSVRQYVIVITRPIEDEPDDGDSVEELRMSLCDELHDTGDGTGDTDILDGSLTIHEKDSGLADSCKNDDSSENDLMSPRSSKYNTTSSGGCCDMDGDLEINVRDTGIQTNASVPSPKREIHRHISLTHIENELLAVTKHLERAQTDRTKEARKHTSAPPPPPKPPRAPRTSSLSPQHPVEISAATPHHRTKHSTHKINGDDKNKAYVAARPGLTKMSSPEFCAFSSPPRQEATQFTFNPKGRVPDGNDWSILSGMNKFGSPPGKLTSFSPKPSACTSVVPMPSPAVPTGRSTSNWQNLSQLKTVREDEELCPPKQHIYEQILPNITDCASLQRSSGARSASKRPVRNKFLQERAQKISTERCGLTTDDDTRSELKLGRYWSRDERRRHLQMAEVKRRRENETFRFQLAVPVKPKIILLSQQKQLKKFAKNGDGFNIVCADSPDTLWHTNGNTVPHLINNVTTV